MPITGERMLAVLNIAQDAVGVAERMRKLAATINHDIHELRYSVLRCEGKMPKGEYEFMLDVLDQLKISTSADLLYQNADLNLSTETIQALGREQAHFEANQKKHKNKKQREKMRENAKIEAQMVNEFWQRQERSEAGQTSRRQTRQERAIQEDLEYLAQRGEKQHPEQGPCDGEPCRMCEKLGLKAFGEIQKEEQDPIAYENVEDLNQDFMPKAEGN